MAMGCWFSIHGKGLENKSQRGRTITLPSGYVKIGIENGHLQWIYQWIMVIFYSYVSLPEGI